MAIPPRRAPVVPNRAVRSFTLGKGSFFPEISSQASSPNLAAVASTPPRVNTLGVDQQSRSVTVPQLQKGQRYVATVTIPLPNLPTTGLSSRAGDTVTFQASLTVANSVTGMHVVQFTATPQAKIGGQIFTGPSLPPGQNYSSYQVFASVTFAADTNAGGGLVKITANGTISVGASSPS